MQTNTMKAHYLINLMKGFENIDGTRLYSVTQINDTIEFNATVVTYDKDYNSINVSVEGVLYLSDMTYKVKAVGKGSRKYLYNVKNEMDTIINHLTSEATKQYKSDCTGSHDMTVTYYYNQLVSNGATIAQTNQFDNDSYNKNVNEIEQLFNAIMNELVINNETIYTVEEMDFINDDNYIIVYQGSNYDKAVEAFKSLHVNGKDAQMYNNKDVILFENYNTIDNVIKCNDLFLHDIHTVNYVTDTDLYNNNYTLTPIVNKKTINKGSKEILTTDIKVTNHNNEVTVYFNTSKEISYTQAYYSYQSKMYSLILNNINNENNVLNHALFKHIVNNSSCWITVINDNPLYNKGCLLINITLNTINKPISCYITHEIFNRYINKYYYDNTLQVI